MVFRSRHRIDAPYVSWLEEARRRVRDGEERTFILLAPTRNRADYLERELVASAQGRAVASLTVSTFMDLVSRIRGHIEPGVRLLSEAESSVLLEQAIKKLFKEDKLRYFEPRAGWSAEHGSAFPLPYGTFETVFNTVFQLKESGVYLDQFRRGLENAKLKRPQSTEVRRAEDIFLIYNAYEEQHGGVFTDAYGQLQRLNFRYEVNEHRPEEIAQQNVSRDFRAVFPDVRDLFLDRFPRVERPALRLLQALSEVQGLEVSFGLDWSTLNPALSAGIKKLEEELFVGGFTKVASAELERAMPESDVIGSVDQLRAVCAEHLFGDDTPEKFALDENGPKVTWSEAATREAEVADVARRIKLTIAANPGLESELSRIAVVASNTASYTPVFRDVFERFGLPVQIQDRYRLENSKLASSFFTLLDASVSGMRGQDIIHLLSSPFCTIYTRAGERVDPAPVLHAFARYKLSGDLPNWLKTISDRHRVVERQLLDDEESPATEFKLDRYERGALEAERKAIQNVLDSLEILKSLLSPLRENATPSQFTRKLRQLLLDVRMRENIVAASGLNSEELELDARAYRALTGLIEQMEHVYQMMGLASVSHEASFYVERMKAAAQRVRFNPRFRSSAIQVNSLDQMQGLEFDHVFMVGLTDGAFPRPYEPQVFLLDSHQKGEERQLQEDRLLFYAAVTGFTRSLHLSWPRSVGGGEALDPSYFVGSLRSILEIPEAKCLTREDGLFSTKEVLVSASEIMRRNASLEPFAIALAGTPLEDLEARLTVEFASVLRAEALRRIGVENDYSGVLEKEQLPPLTQQFLDHCENNVWSVSQLETYATCGFKYMSQYLLKLAVNETTDEDGLDSREAGTALHEVLRQVLSERREKHLPALQDIGEEDIPAVEQAMVAAADRFFSESGSEHPYARLDKYRLTRSGVNEGVFKQFIARERERAPYTHRPEFFEVSFGMPVASRRSVDNTLRHDDPIEIAGIRLRGKIDRIDLESIELSGELRPRSFSLIDYKTGSGRAHSEIVRGTSLQLPLYMRVAEDLLARHFGYELNGVAGLYHTLLSKGRRTLGIALKDHCKVAYEGFRSGNGLMNSPEDLAELIEETFMKAREYVRGVVNGRFALVDRDLTAKCSYCDFRSACRVEEAESRGILNKHDPAAISTRPKIGVDPIAIAPALSGI